MTEETRPVLVTDLLNLCETDTDLLHWLLCKGLLHNYSLYDCSRCEKGGCIRLRKFNLHDGYIWFCINCSKGTCLRKNSFLSRSKLSFQKTLKLVYFWCHKLPLKFSQVQTQESLESIENWFDYCREICLDYTTNHCAKIGGPGITIEVDDHNFGKHKQGGKKNSDRLVLGGIERDNKKNLFLVQIPNRSAETIFDVISAYVAEGSIIITSTSESYKSCGTVFYDHITVDRTKEIKNVRTGACINSIQNAFSCLQKAFTSEIKTNALPLYLAEFIVRRKFLTDSKNKFLDFIDIIVLQHVLADSFNISEEEPLYQFSAPVFPPPLEKPPPGPKPRKRQAAPSSDAKPAKVQKVDQEKEKLPEPEVKQEVIDNDESQQ